MAEGSSQAGRVVVTAADTYQLPHAAGWAWRHYVVKASAAAALTIVATAGEAPEIDAAGGSLVLGGDGNAFPVAEFVSDGVAWWLVHAV